MNHSYSCLPQPLAQAMLGWPGSGWQVRLENIYAALPATSCERRGACCALLPPMHPVEMLAWLGGLCQADPETSCVLAADLVRHFLLNAAQRLPCPWAREDSCARYEGRFFGCRAYGLWSKQAYQPRRIQSMEAANKVQEAWQGMGVSLPPEVCAPPPAYCDQVEPMSGPALDDARLDALESELAGLGSGEPWHGLLSGCGGDLSFLVAGLALGWRECLQTKVAVTHAILAGDHEQAEQTLAQAGQAARAWARDLISGPA